MGDQKISLCVGEARCIRDITLKLFEIDNFTASLNSDNWDYQTAGYEPLLKFLERKYSAPVIITNGANHALYAVMQVLKNKGRKNLGFRIPFWGRIPKIAKQVNIGYTPFEGVMAGDASLNIDCYLATLPNNPDGYLPSLDIIRMSAALSKEKDIPLIHDAVYYTRSYLPVDHPIEPIGDLQIFSASKHYGLSSLRVGYIVVYNASFYRDLLNFIEISTVGCSIVSQKLFLYLLKREQQLPLLEEQFVKLTREEIKKAKNIIKNVDQSKVELSRDFDRSYGVFGWVKPKIENLFEKINVDVLNGENFGKPGYVRLNLAAGNDIIEEVVKRINGV